MSTASVQAQNADRRTKRRRRGVSLVEMMVAMVVLSFGLLGVAALQVRAITEGSGGQHLSIASAIARNRLEELNSFAWDASDLDASGGAWVGTQTIDALDHSAGTDVDLDETYTLTERISWDDPDVPDVQIKTIEVRVTWSDEKRQNRQVLLTSARLRETNE